RWIDAFWGDWIDDIDPQHSDDEAAYDRCVVDPSFLGSYAATTMTRTHRITFSACSGLHKVVKPALKLSITPAIFIIGWESI
ncbi:MAG: hypothetical protein KC506_03410, partial [Nanoarchaeota archaeon]|nr:hypothetical protein [Nanoarchaeota archaeon]